MNIIVILALVQMSANEVSNGHFSWLLVSIDLLAACSVSAICGSHLHPTISMGLLALCSV